MSYLVEKRQYCHSQLHICDQSINIHGAHLLDLIKGFTTVPADNNNITGTYVRKQKMFDFQTKTPRGVFFVIYGK